MNLIEKYMLFLYYMISKQTSQTFDQQLILVTLIAFSASAPNSIISASHDNKVASCYSASGIAKRSPLSSLMNGNASPQTVKKSSSKRKAKTPSWKNSNPSASANAPSSPNWKRKQQKS